MHQQIRILDLPCHLAVLNLEFSPVFWDFGTDLGHVLWITKPPMGISLCIACEQRETTSAGAFKGFDTYGRQCDAYWTLGELA